MWVRGAAIRPVPSYAVLGLGVLERVERELADGKDDETHAELDESFARFEITQPFLADRISTVLSKPLDETALALGYFLAIAVWLAFEASFKERLVEVSEDALAAAEDALTLEEELRASHADEPLDLDDVMAMEQPAVLAFVHDHIEAALDPTSSTGSESGETHEIDVDDVHVVYRTILMLTLALSHAVVPGEGVVKVREMMA